MAFAQLQQRLGRKEPSPKIQRDIPVVLLAYDLLEIDGADVRSRPLHERRARLEALLADDPMLPLVKPLYAESWPAFAQLRNDARAHHSEGLMLKRIDSTYGVGRTRGAWWKWKIDPYTIDAVLVYAQPGQGRRASLFTDYTFALWHQGELVAFAKAYSGLTDAELRKVDAWIRSHTLEKFGPVRRVAPDLVFELAFESIQLSKRHKSGVAVRFPRIVRWRLDKPPTEADTLDRLKALVAVEGSAPL
jgi:DNA ligase-1